MRGDESDWIVNKRNGFQSSNMIWDRTETGLPSSTQLIEDVDRALEALEIVFLQSDMLKLCPKQNQDIAKLFPDIYYNNREMMNPIGTTWNRLDQNESQRENVL